MYRLKKILRKVIKMGLLKLVFFVLVVLVFIGLGTNGTLSAALSGYHKVESNPTVQELQQKAVSTARAEISTQVHNIENATTTAIDAKVNQAMGVSP